MQKKEMQVKSVHRFTDNAAMRFRPIHFNLPKQIPPPNPSVVDKVSQILGNFFGKSKPDPKPQNFSKNKTYSKSALVVDSPESKNKTIAQSRIRGNSAVLQSAQEQIKTLSKMQTREETMQGENLLCYLQKVTTDTFLIGNQHQLDLITISGIYDNVIDTEINWSFNLQKRIAKLAVDNKKCFLAVEVEGEVAVYRYDSKRLKIEPAFVASTRLLGEPRFLVFLKDSQFAVCYDTSACVYQIEESNCIRMIFNKRYGVGEQLRLFQVPRPVENVLNIFFVERSQSSKTYVLWRLELELKTIAVSHGFKSIVRIYDIPAGLLNKFKIDNFSKDIIILNFKFEILAAKDGFIIDAANTNIQEDGSCLVYQGDHLLHISENKLFIYGFRIITTMKPNKIQLPSLDSIEISKDPRFRFFDCLEMLNGNFVLFFQIKPDCNNKLKGEIDYIMTVTQKLSIQEKLNEIFNFRSTQELKQMAEENFTAIEEKCDMAFKIGLNRRQIYLQLWNKSNKRDIADYKFLLDTMDYDTIKLEIEKKLKKASMSFNEVFKIEQACFEMLRVDLFSNSNCGEKAIKNYLISHFLLRKLTYFRNTNIHNPACTRLNTQPGEEEPIRTFVIDIQQYVQTVKLELKSHFLEYVTRLCFELKNEEQNFRIFLRDFRFPLRIMYQTLLETLIIHAKNKLIHFLKAIPQMLPFDGVEVEEGQAQQGLWSPIEPDEWHKSLHIEQISTIYNKDYVEELTKTVWFKRNQNSLHDLVALSKQKILEVQQFNQSDAVFYFFIQKLFQHSRDEVHLQRVVDFLETSYVRLPAHLKGKIFLYRRLWTYFQMEHHPQLTSFNAFLKLRDHELFKELFRYEKVKKGCLLKDAKHIYEAAPNGVELYHEGLLNYFASDLSEISDLKYILNRLNNEKREFHIENEGIYVVLVKAMQMKLKLGSDNDIPLDEVMIYVENIPLSKNNPVIEDLKTVERINEESDRFKKMRLNMSLLHIIENCEDVVTALINEEIREKGVLAITDRQALVQTSYGILAEVQTIKDKIYKGKYSDLPYFIYLSKLLENQRLIPDVALLLQDKYLLEYYMVDDRLIENLVLYMYKWKFNQESTFVKNKEYLEALLGLLPPQSECRRYIEAEIEFALMLSTPNFPIEYPLTQSETISIEEIASIVNNLSAAEVALLDVERLHEVVQRMQELCVDMEVTSLQEIYEVCILRLVALNSVRHAIPKIRKLVELHGNNQNYAVVFCYLVVGAILNEMPDVHRKGLLRIAFYTFDQPLLLLDVVERRLQVKLSNEEEEFFLNDELSAVKHMPCFRADNPLLDDEVRERVAENKEKYYRKVEDLVFQTWLHLNNNREDFERAHDYTFYYIMLLHNPYALAKYLSVCPQQVNIRLLRSYISYVFKEDIFHGINVLYYGRRLFMIALEAALTLLPVEVVASQFKGNDPHSDEDQLDLELDDTPTDPTSFPAKLRKSIETFNRKIASFKGPKVEEADKKKRRVEALLSSQASIQDNDASEYPFNDSDDNYDDLQEEKGNKVQVQRRRKADWHFDPNKERKFIMEREGKNVALYLSSAGEDDIRKSSPRMLKSSKTFHHAFHSVKIPSNNSKKMRKSSDSMEKGAFDLIERSDSLGIKEMAIHRRDEEEEDLTLSQNQDDLFKSAQPILFRPADPADPAVFNSYSPEHSPLEDSVPQNSPMKLIAQNSVVAVDVEDDEGAYESGFRVNVQEIDEDKYTPVEAIKKQLLADAGEGEQVFDLSIIIKEEEREIGNFEEYLRELISCIYADRSAPLSLLLQLIKQIKTAFPGAGVSSEFLEYYIALENYNQKYKSEYLIRQMFPAEALFLPSKDPIVLFQAVKQHILEVASYDRIVVIAQLLTSILRKPEIKDDLYLSYLAREIELYGNDSSSSELELKMQRERIEGMLPQITTSTLLLDRAEAILRPIAASSHAPAVAEMIREALRKKKRDYLIREFDKKIAQFNL